MADPRRNLRKVHADDGNVYMLRDLLSPQEDAWTLEAYQRGWTMRLL
jgi:hypothetical protein